MKPRTDRGTIVRFCLVWALLVAWGSAIASPKILPRLPVWPTFDYGLGKSIGNREIQKLGPTDELFLWRVDGENSTVYLMGSIHLLKQSSYPLADLYEYVYDECDQLVVESNETDSEEHYEYLTNKMLLSGSKKLSHYLSSSAYNWIQDLAIDNDLPADFFNQFKPEAVGLFIAQIKAENYGFDFTLGVDFHFIDKAEDDFIPIYSLEGVERYDLFFTGSLAKQADELEDFINEIKNGKVEKELTEIVNRWLNDYEGMVEYILEGEKKDKKDNDISMKTRNIAWIPKIENFINQDNVTLVIAGAAHFFGDYSIVKLLKNKGYKVKQLHDVDVPSISFETAISNSNIKILKEYLPFHPNLNLTFKEYINWNPLHEAALSGGIETVKLLLENKAKVGIKNNGGLTPLYIAAVKNRYDICKLLINNGAYVNTRDEVMNTPLHATAELGHTTIMELLLENGTTVDIRNTDDGWTPLHNAAAGGKVESIKLLLQNGADINGKSFIGETPLHFAASHGHKVAVESLVSNGADLAAKDDKDKTAHEIAIINNHNEIAKYLDEKTIHKTLLQAAKDNDIHSLNKHIAANSNLNQKDMDSWTALHLSVYYGYLEFAEVLINNNASIDAKHNLGWTALHIASWQGHLEIVQTLISNGASINAKVNNDERTALHIAVMYGHYEIAKTLIENGIDVHSDTFLGETALDIAIRKDLVRIQELIKDQTLKISSFKYSGQFQFDINGMKGATFLIEASTDLKLWAPVGEFKNRDGVVKFSDRTSPLFDQQFYRVKVVE